jgi:hypothetical protein
VSDDSVKKLDPKNPQDEQLIDLLEKSANERDAKRDVRCHHDDRLK